MRVLMLLALALSLSACDPGGAVIRDVKREVRGTEDPCFCDVREILENGGFDVRAMDTTIRYCLHEPPGRRCSHFINYYEKSNWVLGYTNECLEDLADQGMRWYDAFYSSGSAFKNDYMVTIGVDSTGSVRHVAQHSMLSGWP